MNLVSNGRAQILSPESLLIVRIVRSLMPCHMLEHIGGDRFANIADTGILAKHYFDTAGQFSPGGEPCESSARLVDIIHAWKDTAIDPGRSLLLRAPSAEQGLYSAGLRRLGSLCASVCA